MFTFFTEVIKKGIIDKHGKWLGRPHDFLAGLGEPYPRFTSLIVAAGVVRRRYAIVPWSAVEQTNEQFHLKIGAETLTFAPEYSSDTTVRKHILDQQVVDTYNKKIVRVNDIHLLRVENDLRIAHVDVGLRGLVRRLGWERIVDLVVGFISPHSAYLAKESFIAWKYIQPLSIHPDNGTIQLNVSQDQMRTIPPPDLSEMLVELDPYQRAAMFRALDMDMQVGILTEMDIKQQKELIKALDSKTCANIFERMPADEATDLLGELSRRDADRILTQVGTKKARRLSTLLRHKSNSAGGLMTTEILTLPNTMTVGEAIEHVKSLPFKAETIYYAYVVDPENHLEGIITFKHLLTSRPEQKITEVMVSKPVSVHVSDSAREVAYIIDKYNFLAVPVIDQNKVLQGIITIDDVLSLVISESWGKKTGLM